MGAFKLRDQWGSSSVAGRHETGVVKVRVQGGTIAVRICVGKGHLDRYGAGLQRGAASGRVLASFCQCRQCRVQPDMTDIHIGIYIL